MYTLQHDAYETQDPESHSCTGIIMILEPSLSTCIGFFIADELNLPPSPLLSFTITVDCHVEVCSVDDIIKMTALLNQSRLYKRNLLPDDLLISLDSRVRKTFPKILEVILKFGNFEKKMDLSCLPMPT